MNFNVVYINTREKIKFTPQNRVNFSAKHDNFLLQRDEWTYLAWDVTVYNFLTLDFLK